LVFVFHSTAYLLSHNWKLTFIMYICVCVMYAHGQYCLLYIEINCTNYTKTTLMKSNDVLVYFESELNTIFLTL